MNILFEAGQNYLRLGRPSQTIRQNNIQDQGVLVNRGRQSGSEQYRKPVGHLPAESCFCPVSLLMVTSAVRLQGEPQMDTHASRQTLKCCPAPESGETRNTLNYFEQVREFFLKFNGHGTEGPAPVTIVIFGSEKEYEPYSPEQASHWRTFSPRRDRDYIVMGERRIAAHVATHEYTHLIAEHAGLHYPPGLNEGLCRTFFNVHDHEWLHRHWRSDTQQDTGSCGKTAGFRFPRSWLPIMTRLTTTKPARREACTNEGWAAVHFYRHDQRVPAKVFRVSQRRWPTVRIRPKRSRKVFGKPLSTFETELRGYIGQGAFNHLIAKIEIDSNEEGSGRRSGVVIRREDRSHRYRQQAQRHGGTPARP
jgi:hypothetical protein